MPRAEPPPSSRASTARAHPSGTGAVRALPRCAEAGRDRLETSAEARRRSTRRGASDSRKAERRTAWGARRARPWRKSAAVGDRRQRQKRSSPVRPREAGCDLIVQADVEDRYPSSPASKNFAPEGTNTSSGLPGSPSFLPEARSTAATLSAPAPHAVRKTVARCQERPA